MNRDDQPLEWQVQCEIIALNEALRQFVPSIRAQRFHKRKAWFRQTAELFIVEIDRGAIELKATGKWPATVAILCRDLYVLTRIVPRRKGDALLEFKDAKLRVSAPGLKWTCPATLETPPTSFISSVNSTYLRPRKHKELE